MFKLTNQTDMTLKTRRPRLGATVHQGNCDTSAFISHSSTFITLKFKMKNKDFSATRSCKCFTIKALLRKTTRSLLSEK